MRVSCCLVFSVFTLLFVFINKVHSGAVALTTHNIDALLTSNELVFVNFYANWCRFSQMLEPIYDEFADKIAKEFPTPNKVLIAKLDCDAEQGLAQRFHINKYPTLKVFRFGAMAKREYRGQRSADAFAQFIREQAASSLKVVHTHHEANSLQLPKRAIIGYFADEHSPNYQMFYKMSNVLRDVCSFVAALGDQVADTRVNGDVIMFRDLNKGFDSDVAYTGPVDNYDMMNTWVSEHCTPLVREITFENAEELTEEGLPFLILFHKLDDAETLRLFEQEVTRQLKDHKGTITTVHADGLKFSHPLNHLGKTTNDLPMIAIDSFRHMYLFPDIRKLSDGYSLNQFVNDLHSGKLHREFHNGPDPTPEPPKQIHGESPPSQHLPKTEDAHPAEEHKTKESTPPESVFIKLSPSSDRYSFKNTEL